LKRDREYNDLCVDSKGPEHEVRAFRKPVDRVGRKDLGSVPPSWYNEMETKKDVDCPRYGGVEGRENKEQSEAVNSEKAESKLFQKKNKKI